ncbi:hypothetical protein BT93_C1115 [Corymbia citriodora subsp. variegata]|nr:hypothetical protein BT93_C1115 [Corymbia citriodora subsp. variegata]
MVSGQITGQASKLFPLCPSLHNLYQAPMLHGWQISHLLFNGNSDSQNFPNLLDYLEVLINVSYLEPMPETNVQPDSIRDLSQIPVNFTLHSLLGPPSPCHHHKRFLKSFWVRKKSCIAQMCLSQITYNPNIA